MQYTDSNLLTDLSPDMSFFLHSPFAVENAGRLSQDLLQEVKVVIMVP